MRVCADVGWVRDVYILGKRECIIVGRSKGLKLADILVTVVVAIVFGIIYKLWGPLSTLLAVSGMQLDQLVYGMWFIAATVAFMLIRKPGVGLLAEAAASTGELILGSQYGVPALIYGIFQGLGAELVFALFGYKRYSLGVVCLASVGATAGSFVMDYYYGYMADLSVGIILLQIVLRTIGSVVLTGIFAYYLVRALEKSGVTSLLRPVSSDDLKSLDQK